MPLKLSSHTDAVYMGLVYNSLRKKKTHTGLVPVSWSSESRKPREVEDEGSIRDLLWLLFCEILNMREANPLLLRKAQLSATVG